MTDRVKINLIIHLFALAHAAMIIILRYLLNWNDDVVLTILTILMVIVITRSQNVSIDVATLLALLCCFAGFYLGTKGADLLRKVDCDFVSRYVNLFTTVIVTEILGWTTWFITRRLSRR